jgi:hypothetical protein
MATQRWVLWFTLRMVTPLLLVLGSVAMATAGSTMRELGTNVTFVNLHNGSNSITINYYKQDGQPWRTPETLTLGSLGEQIIKYQYSDSTLRPAGKGSIVTTASGRIGTLVQIQARFGQKPSSGAYISPTEGAVTSYVPLVARNYWSNSANMNSQIIVQNTSYELVAFTIQLLNADGSSRYTKSVTNLPIGTAYTYDLDDESRNNVPTGWHGSAVVTANNGSVAVVTHLFNGYNGLQTYSAFTQQSSSWSIPLFQKGSLGKLDTPVIVQNASPWGIPAGRLKLICKRLGGVDPATFTITNPNAVPTKGLYIFDPRNDSRFPSVGLGVWYGSCVIESDVYATRVVVQMFSGLQTAAYEATPSSSTAKTNVVPLYARRLANGFATPVTVQNLSNSATANIEFVYKGASGTQASCTKTITAQIPPGGNLIHNHRRPDGETDSVPQIPVGCYGSLVIRSSDQPITTLMQLTNYLDETTGDWLMAHNAFSVN